METKTVHVDVDLFEVIQIAKMALDFSEERTIKWIAEFGLYNIVRYPNCDHEVAKILAAEYLSVVEVLQKKCHLKYIKK
jgi:hypothetical protein